MRIDILYVRDCPNRATARERVHAALDHASATATVSETEVANAHDAALLGMRGSPTILIDGRDPFGGEEPSVSCRRYPTAAGIDGAPSVEQLLEILR